MSSIVKNNPRHPPITRLYQLRALCIARIFLPNDVHRLCIQPTQRTYRSGQLSVRGEFRVDQCSADEYAHLICWFIPW